MYEFAKLDEMAATILVKTFLFFFFLFWRSPYFGRKKALNFGFRPKNTLNFGVALFFFFLEITKYWAEKSFEFPSFPRHFASSFGQTVWNWFKINENSSQGRLHTSHSFKIAPPFSKSWLRACLRTVFCVVFFGYRTFSQSSKTTK